MSGLFVLVDSSPSDSGGHAQTDRIRAEAMPARGRRGNCTGPAGTAQTPGRATCAEPAPGSASRARAGARLCPVGRLR
jgi:hypothetical protein